MHSFGWFFLHFWCSSVVYHPRKMGKNEIKVGAVQATPIIKAATLTVIYVEYLSGLTIAKYRSTAIQHKCNVDTVEKWTSKEFHKSHIL